MACGGPQNTKLQSVAERQPGPGVVLLVGGQRTFSRTRTQKTQNESPYTGTNIPIYMKGFHIILFFKLKHEIA